MWEFRPIGKYYELLVDGDSIYLCRRPDTIIQAVIEDLCNRHNNQVKNLIDKLNKEGSFIVDLDAAYDNGYEDGKLEGYRLGVADALGKDKIE